MTKEYLTFKIFGYWHAGSGEGEGAYADRKVVRTAKGVPFIPGRTVKGLVREAVQLRADAGFDETVNQDTVDLLFGSSSRENDGRFATKPGVLVFGDAFIRGFSPSGLSKDVLEGFFETFASTKIDGNGMAEPKTLRKVEVAVPLTLISVVEEAPPGTGSPTTDWVKILKEAAPMVRSLGSHRHRGLGRVCVTVGSEVS